MYATDCVLYSFLSRSSDYDKIWECNTIAPILPFFMQKNATRLRTTNQHDCIRFTFLPNKYETRLRSLKYRTCPFNNFPIPGNTLFKNSVRVVNSKLKLEGAIVLRFLNVKRQDGRNRI